MYDDTLKKRGQRGGVRRSSNLKLAVILCAFAMILSAVAIIPAGESDAEDEIYVSTWDELKDAIDIERQALKIVLTDDIIDDSDDEDAIEIEGDRYIQIILNGHKIDRMRAGYGTYDGRLFEISGAGTRVEISDGTLTGGHGKGGCMLIDHADIVELTNVNIIDNFSDSHGGALYVDRTELVIKGGKIADNTSFDGDGGAIYAKNDSAVTMKNVEVYGNYAKEGNAGAIYIRDSPLVLIDCNFHNNYATGDEGDGGAIYAEGISDLYANISSISGTTFTENHTLDEEDCDGGAIYLDDTKIEIISSKFVGNYCGFDGGAIYSDDSDLRIADTEFINNRAPDSGGALRFYDGKYHLENLKLEGNYANNCGGAIYLNNDADVWIKDITITGNSARLDGGGLLVGAEDDNSIEIKGLIVIKDNNASRDGDNVFLRKGLVLKCDNLDQNSRIGVELQEGNGKITKNFSKNNPDVDAARIFFSDNSKYYVALDPDSGEARMYKEGTSGDMSDNTIVWICVGIVVAIVALAAVAQILRSKRSKNQ